MERLIKINYPESLAFSLKMENQEFKDEIKTLSLIKLYELGKISSLLKINKYFIRRINKKRNMDKS